MTTRYDQRMTTVVFMRCTPAQANSLTAVAHAMQLDVSSFLRAAVDEFIEDVPEPRLFTRKYRITPLRANSPAAS